MKLVWLWIGSKMGWFRCPYRDCHLCNMVGTQWQTTLIEVAQKLQREIMERSEVRP